MPDGSTVSLGEISHIVHQPGLSLLTTNSNRYSLDVLAYRNIAPISILSKNALAVALVVLHSVWNLSRRALQVGFPHTPLPEGEGWG